MQNKTLKITSNFSKNIINNSLYITGSKSESNRLLILQALYPNYIKIKNISNSEDTNILEKSLNNFKKNDIININHAGTAMRFLTAFFSVKIKKEIILTGSNRMKQRPISILVDSLRLLGARINYLENEGYPPIKIFSNKLYGKRINVNSKISSQYISSLMLIGSFIENGLEIFLSGKITSYPYILMTFNILNNIGLSITWKNRVIKILNTPPKFKKTILVESDWSSVSYYYSLASLSNKCNLCLNSYKEKSIQGDSIISKIYKDFFGVNTIFKENKIFLTKNIKYKKPNYIKINLNKYPDIAQTIVTTCLGLKIKCLLTGLETLKIKETDRLQALQNELKKFNIKSIITSNSIELTNFMEKKSEILENINTYEDHRMAMSFAILGIYFPIKINNYKVVQKSYPDFWKDMKKLGFDIIYL